MMIFTREVTMEVVRNKTSKRHSNTTWTKILMRVMALNAGSPMFCLFLSSCNECIGAKQNLLLAHKFGAVFWQ